MSITPAAALHPKVDAKTLAWRVAELPPMPAALSEVLRALSNDHLSLARCVQLIETDPALAARLVQLANSPYYGCGGRIGSIEAAVSRLGLRAVAGLLSTLAVRDVIQQTGKGNTRAQHLMRHLIATARLARDLARDLSRELGADPEEAYLAGLLHDIGALMLEISSPELTAEVDRLVAGGVLDLQAAELLIFGATHGQVGKMIVQQWDFPAAIAEAIADHIAPAMANGRRNPLSVVVYVASKMVDAVDDTGVRDAIENLGAHPEDLPGIEAPSIGAALELAGRHLTDFAAE